MIFCEPDAAYAARHAVGPTSIAPLRGVRNVRAPAVLDAVRAYSGKPAPMWTILNSLAAAERGIGHRPVYRPERRSSRIAYWHAARELLGVRLLYRHRGLISTSPIAFMPKPRKPRPASEQVLNTKATVVAEIAEKGGSNGSEPLAGMSVQTQKSTVSLSNTGRYDGQNEKVTPAITKSARPTLTTEQIWGAATLLASRPRPWKRKWTGVLAGERVRRRTLVEVPTGEVLPAVIIQRNWVYVMRSPDEPGPFLERFRASQVLRVKNPAAVLLGRLKLGWKEQPSAAKAAAARRNGCRPCRAGRRRGRPRKAAGAGGAAGP